MCKKKFRSKSDNKIVSLYRIISYCEYWNVPTSTEIIHVLSPTGKRWEENPGGGGSHRLREVWGAS